MAPNPKSPRASLSQAVERFVRLTLDPRPSRRVVEDAERWLDETPDNAKALGEASSRWNALDGLRGDARLEAMLAHARADLSRSAHAQRSRRARIGAAIAASVAAIIALPFGYGAYSDYSAKAHAETYRTPVGKVSAIYLHDGTIATLDTDTKLRAWNTRRGRFVELQRGRARFKVAKDPSHPFSVLAAGQTVTALGTDFDVDMRPDYLRVSLVEGRLRVVGDSAVHAPIYMAAGHRFTQNRQGWTLSSANASADVSWSENRLWFDDRTVREIADELNRYSAHKIIIDDPEIANFRMSARVRTDDIQPFLAAVERLSQAQVKTVGANYQITRRN